MIALLRKLVGTSVEGASVQARFEENIRSTEEQGQELTLLQDKIASSLARVEHTHKRIQTSSCSSNLSGGYRFTFASEGDADERDELACVPVHEG